MECVTNKPIAREHIEICFVRMLEALHDDDLRLVLRDKIAPLPPKNTLPDSVQVRLAHSDDALAVMFNTPAPEDEASRFSLRIEGECCNMEVGSDSNIYIQGIESSAVKYFSHYDKGVRWYVAVISLRKAAIRCDAKGVKMCVTLPHTSEQEAQHLSFDADFV